MNQQDQVTDTILTDDIWVVIPAFNEGVVLASVVHGVVQRGYRVVVVDDCSRDETAAIARKAGAYVCSHSVNLGQGAALQTGIQFALGKNAKVIVTFDADGQHQADEIQKVCAPILRGDAEIVLGSRFLQGAVVENISSSKALTLKLAVWFSRLTTGLNLTDTHNGFRALSRSAAMKIKIYQNRMAHASEILSEISRLKLKFQEIPVTIKYTEYSMTKGQKISNSINILWESAMSLIKGH